MSFINNFKKVIYYLSPWLGDYDEENSSCVLYNVDNKEYLHKEIKASLFQITKSFQYIILSPKEERTNVKILDIDI